MDEAKKAAEFYGMNYNDELLDMEKHQVDQYTFVILLINVFFNHLFFYDEKMNNKYDFLNKSLANSMILAALR